MKQKATNSLLAIIAVLLAANLFVMTNRLTNASQAVDDASLWSIATEVGNIANEVGNCHIAIMRLRAREVLVAPSTKIQLSSADMEALVSAIEKRLRERNKKGQAEEQP